MRKIWAEVKVGDVIHLSCNEVIPADLVLLWSSDPHGLCYIDTSNIDGENNLKQRLVVNGIHQQVCIIIYYYLTNLYFLLIAFVTDNLCLLPTRALQYKF